MEAGFAEHGDEEEYVLLDLDAVMGHVTIRPDTPYVLTGLDTLNPMLIIDGKVKLIGEYEETMGTCLVFSENEEPVLHEETGPSDANLFSGRYIMDKNQALPKEVKPVARLEKVLKFKLLLEGEDDAQDQPSTEGNASNPSRLEPKANNGDEHSNGKTFYGGANTPTEEK